MDYVYWERVVSAQVVPPVRAFTVLTVGYDEERGAFWERMEPSCGLLVEVVESYSRLKRGQYDAGDPSAPPTARTLRDEGYRFIYRQTRIRHLIEDWEGPGLIPLTSDCDTNARVVVYPTGERVPEYPLWAAYKSLAAKYKVDVPKHVCLPQ